MMNNNTIKTWQKFAKSVRNKQDKLLNRLDDFPDSILIAGCQRSGTTMLARIITQSEGMVNYWFGPDDELDAALILSGNVEHEPRGRYCFQATYLNERYPEYFEHKNFRMVWVLRNPHSVVYSMLHNWPRFGLNEVFRACATPLLDDRYKHRLELFGHWGVPRLLRACYAYNAKTSQIGLLRAQLDESRLQVVDYDDLVKNKARILPRIYEFLGKSYKIEYEQAIKESSLNKSSRADKREQNAVEQLCMPVYKQLRELVTLS
jgi:hypothetical protein